MRIALYARVSTNDGRQNTENQLSVLRDWATRLGDPFPAEYIDEASGAKSDRKALANLMKSLHQHDVLLIWSLDRLSREGISKLSSYLDHFKARGVRVMSHTESWLDTGGPVAELLVAIMAWVAAQERRRFTERIKAGLETARKKGKKLGRPEVEVDRLKVLSLYNQGRSFRAIAMECGISKTLVGRIVSDGLRQLEGQRAL